LVAYPISSHYDATPAAASDEMNVLAADAHLSRVVINSGIDEQVFQAKCAAVAKKFVLSPRESDVLNYLVRGRNADYICNKLVVSQNTVKSHIASIYRKTSIHSQPRLIAYIEEFEIDAAHYRDLGRKS